MRGTCDQGWFQSGGGGTVNESPWGGDFEEPPVSSPLPFTRSDSLTLAPFKSAVPCARYHVGAILVEWDLGAVIEDAELIVSELVTNAVSASEDSGDPIEVRVFASNEALVIEVWDVSAGLPVKRDPSEDEPDGRGLMLIEALSSEWGAGKGPQGAKVVWARLQISSR